MPRWLSLAAVLILWTAGGSRAEEILSGAGVVEIAADRGSPYHRLLEQMARSDQQSPLALSLGVAAVLVLLFLSVSLLLRRTVRNQTRELIRRNQDLQRQNDLRRRAEVALFRANRVLEKTFASMQDALLVFAPDKGRILNYNRTATRMFGYPEQDLPQTPFRQLLADQADLGRLHEPSPSEAAQAGATGYRCEMRRRDGTTFPAELSLTPLEANPLEEAAWVAHVRDLTERLRAEEALRQTEARLLQAQKMEAIGTLAGGIAHDFNNILTPIIGYTELMADILHSGECPDGSYVEQIHQAAVRARDLVAQILTFSRQREREPIELCLIPIVKEAIKLLRATLPTTVRIELALKAADDRVLIDPTQVHQVLLNLCTNAAHAMRRAGGVLRISVNDHEGSLQGWGTHSTLRPGPYLCLEVSDTGHGIEPSVLPRVFDPFFTTKGPGEGTGMGLAVVHGIVESCGGAVSVESEPGNGAVFRVYLPRCCREATSGPSADPAQPDDDQYGRGERILLVDDEPLVVNAVAATLRHEGYEVDTQSDPGQALTRLRGAPNEVDLLLTDQTMPGMTGLHLAREALVVHPGLPVVLFSGLPDSIDQHECQALGITAVLPKPLRPTQLSRALRRAIDGAKRS